MKGTNHWKTKFFEFSGQKKTIHGWAVHFGLTYACIQSRLKQGTPLDAPKSNRGRPRSTA